MKKIRLIVLIFSLLSPSLSVASLKSSYHPGHRSLTPWLKTAVKTIPYHLPSSAPSFEVILFDVDETLLHFDPFKGLKMMFSSYGEEFNEQDFDRFMKINKSLWKEYQNGNITAEELQKKRFESWGDKLSISAQILNREYINTMVEISAPIEGALELLKALKGEAKLGIVTNGFTQLVERRLEKAGLKGFFDVLVVAEEVGFAKPDRSIFDHALAKMGNPIREKVLMVGDSLDFDVQGGINAGIKTCWLNINNKPFNSIKPDYQISSFKELEILLSKRYSAGVYRNFKPKFSQYSDSR